MSAQPKRKADVSGDASDTDGDGDVDMINVDFDFTGPDEIDYIALKRLFIQLFHTLAPRIDIDALADLVISNGAQNGLGTVIKVVDDVDNDPFAIISPLTLSADPGAPAPARDLHRLLLDKAPSPHPIRDLLLAPARAPPTLLLHERLINLPAQVAAPLYRIMNDELEAAYKDSSLPRPSHYLIFSRVFPHSALPDEDMDVDDEPTKRRRKTQPTNAGKRSTADVAEDDMGMFHPEDAVLAKVRLAAALPPAAPAPCSLSSYRFPHQPDLLSRMLTRTSLCSTPHQHSTSLSRPRMTRTSSSTPRSLGVS